MTTPVLKTPRLTLRPASLADAPAIQKYFNNWNVIKNMGAAVPWPYPDNGAEYYLKNNLLPRMERGEAHSWLLVLNDEGVGKIEFRLKATDDGHRGFWLAEPFWGRGLMTEAVFAVNDFVFDTLGYDELIEMNDESNPASRVLKQKSGGTFLETVDKKAPDGSSRRTEIWKITREGWQKSKPV